MNWFFFLTEIDFWIHEFSFWILDLHANFGTEGFSNEVGPDPALGNQGSYSVEDVPGSSQ